MARIRDNGSDVSVHLPKAYVDMFHEEWPNRIWRQGQADKHGNANSSSGHAVGLWCELSALYWLTSSGLGPMWMGKGDRSDQPDILVCGVAIEVKGQQPHNWSDEFAGTVQCSQRPQWDDKLEKAPKQELVALWGVCELLAGVEPPHLVIKGGTRWRILRAQPTVIIRKQRQYRAYPDLILDPATLLTHLRAFC